MHKTGFILMYLLVISFSGIAVANESAEPKSSATSEDSRWVEVKGARHHVKFDTKELQNDMWKYIKSRYKGVFAEHEKYVFQYQAVSDSEIQIQASCDYDAHFDLESEFYFVFDGGSCYFGILYDVKTRKFNKLVVNGVA